MPDILNPSNYTPPVYWLPPLVKEIHVDNVLRFTNVIVMPFADDVDWKRYWFGLIVVPCLFVSFLVFWCIFACISKCCCKCKHRVNKSWRSLGLGVFAIVMTSTIVLWGLVYSVFTNLQQILNSAQDLSLVFTHYLDSWFLELKTLQHHATKAVNLTKRAQPYCEKLHNETIKDQLGKIISSLDTAVEYVTPIRQDLGKTTTMLQDYVNYYKGMTNSYGWLAFTILVSVMVGICSIFLLVTLVNWWWQRPARGKRISQRFSCVVVFTIGLFCACLGIVMASILQSLTLVVADTCAPEVDQNLQRLFGQHFQAPEFSVKDQCQPTGNLQHTASKAAPLGQIFCYYQSCTPESKITQIHSLLESIANVVNVSGLIQSPPNQTQCRVLVDDMKAYVNDALRLTLLRTLDKLSCQTINQLYRQAVHEFLCHSVVGPLGSSWRYLISASSLLLLGLAVYLYFDLGNLYPEEYLPDDSQELPTISSGTSIEKRKSIDKTQVVAC